MAYIRQYKGRWRAEVQKHGERATHTADTKREVQRWALQKESELDALKGSKGRTLGAAVEHYLATVSVEKADKEWERRRFDAFMQFFPASTPLVQIDSPQLGEWRDWRLTGKRKGHADRRPVTGSTVQREVNLIRNLFTIARREWKWIPHNAFEGVRLPEENDPRHQLWRWRQMKRVMRADRTGKTAEVIRAFRIALATSLRLKEVLEGRYDPAKRVMVLGGGDGRTKGDGTKRVEVPIPRRAIKLLPDKFTVGANEASTLFCKLCNQLLIEDLTFHDTRATALTLLARRMDVMTLARISRHKDINILLRTYYRESAEDISRRI